MASNEEFNASVLQSFGETSGNNLLDILVNKTEDDEMNEITTITPSPYIDAENIIEILKSKRDQFTLFNLNAQSLHTKFVFKNLGFPQKLIFHSTSFRLYIPASFQVKHSQNQLLSAIFISPQETITAMQI